MPEKMFTICKTATKKGLNAVYAPRPETLGPQDVLLKPLYAGICGTDMHIYQWDAWAQGRIKPPLTLGHEFVAEVIKPGNQSTYKKGQIVSAECHIVCGVCPLCRTGQAHLCTQTEIIGVDRNGAFCEELSVPQANLWPVSSGIKTKHAAIFDPIGNAMHTVTTHTVSGAHVLITGAGAIGLAAIAIAQAYGANRISVIEPNTTKHPLAKKLGAHVVYKDGIEAQKDLCKNPPTVLLEMSGHPAALNTGLDALQLGGKAALLGLPSAPITLDIAEKVIFKGLTLTGVVGRRMFDTWQRVDAFLQSHPHVPEALITHTYPAQEFQKAFDALEKGEAIKAVLDFTAF